jgi:hypothetical protein
MRLTAAQHTNDQARTDHHYAEVLGMRSENVGNNTVMKENGDAGAGYTPFGKTNSSEIESALKTEKKGCAGNRSASVCMKCPLCPNKR